MHDLMRGAWPHSITAQRVDLTTTRSLAPGMMLYRAGTSQLACVVEQLMCGANVSTLYTHLLGPHVIYDSQLLWLERLGIPTPRSRHDHRYWSGQGVVTKSTPAL